MRRRLEGGGRTQGDARVQRVIAVLAVLFIRTLRAVSAWRDPSGCSCPEAECCWDYTIRMVRQHGVADGLELALEKVRNCGRDTATKLVPEMQSIRIQGRG